MCTAKSWSVISIRCFVKYRGLIWDTLRGVGGRLDWHKNFTCQNKGFLLNLEVGGVSARINFEHSDSANETTMS